MDVEELFKLQELDLEVDERRSSILKVHEDIAAVQARLEKLAKQSRERSQAKQTAQVKVHKFETEVSAFETKIQGVDKKLMQVTSTKQMEALQHQRESMEGNKEKCEEELLVAYEELEEAETDLSNLAKKTEVEKEKLDNLKNEAGETVQRLEGEIEERLSSRSSLVDGIEESHLQTYQGLREQLGGEVLFTVESNSCPGCGLSQSGSVYNRLKTIGKAQECENCGRLLVYDGIIV